jgi:hypothetical protein
VRPLRDKVAIAIDGGGIRGLIVARALVLLEEQLGRSSHEIFRLAAGTSTGSIISAGIAAGLTAARLTELYTSLGQTIFRRSWRTAFWPLTRYRYPPEPLRQALEQQLGAITMGDFWRQSPPTDVVITAFDLVSNHTCFIKPYKPEYADWPVSKAVLASSSVPTYFPPVEGRYVDGGLGSYANPCYLAAYELRFALGWSPAETTLISLGTGREPHRFSADETGRLWPWDWIGPALGAFLQSADDQQVHLVRTFFEELDFRRFQVDMREPIDMDDVSKLDELMAYGEELGRKILDDETDRVLQLVPQRAPRRMW